MPQDFDSRSHPRSEIHAFIAELAAAGIRPTLHSRSASAGTRPSITVIGWGIGGCRGLLRGCGPGCELVVTTNGNLVLMCEQPERSRLRRVRPRYVDLSDYQDLSRVLSRGRALLLPRPQAA
ncbi:hypothetical protein [Nocardia sp. NPDC005978]|uniref:hypothetical protein n=1 Tax=unclassified Nocardia TaxID=2637762 RepID=UPI0033A48E1B